MLRFVFTIKARHNFILAFLDIFKSPQESGPCSGKVKKHGDVITQNGGQESVGLCGGWVKPKGHSEVSNLDNYACLLIWIFMKL